MAITYVKDIPDFNKKVNELTDITDVKDDIEDIQEDITDIQGDITEIQGDVTEVQGDVSTLAGAVTALDSEVDEVASKYIIHSFSITVLTTDTSATKQFDIPNVPTGYRVVLITPTYNSDLLAYNALKKNVLFSIGNQQNTIRVNIGEGNVGDTVDRTFGFVGLAEKITQNG